MLECQPRLCPERYFIIERILYDIEQGVMKAIKFIVKDVLV